MTPPDERDLFEAEAMSALSPTAFAYIADAAGDSAAANRQAWRAVRLRPRMLRDVSVVDTGATLLGRACAAPIIVAPTAMHQLVDPDGELATAAGVAAADGLYCVSMSANQSFRDIAAVSPDARRWMQIYVRRDRTITRSVCEAAADLGYTAIVLTVDAPVVRSDRPTGTSSVNEWLPLPNLAPGDPRPDVYDIASDYATDLTFRELEAIKGWTGLPLVVKGVLRGDDALACIDAGADAIAVSNHGGRQLDGVVPTAVALPEIVEQVGDRAEVYVDGGIRSGTDVLKALALGADAVMVGRPVVWSLAVGGPAAVTAYLDELRKELARSMALCGAADLGAIDRSLVVP